MRTPKLTSTSNRLNLVFSILITILFSLSLHVGIASAADYYPQTLSSSGIDTNTTMGGASVVWNGFYYKVAYATSEGPPWPEEGEPQYKIEWATIDKQGNLIDIQTLKENLNYSAQNPRLIPIKMYIQPKYILLWIEAHPNKFFKKLHASIIDDDGNMLSDKIISYYINTTHHPFTYEYGTYDAVWGWNEKCLYVVYAEGDPRALYDTGTVNPDAEKLIFCKLYKSGDQLKFVTFVYNNSLTKRKTLFPATSKIGRISLVRTTNNLAVATGGVYPIPFFLLDLNGNTIEKTTSVYEQNFGWPTLHWDGTRLILGCTRSDFFGFKYQIKKIKIQDPDSPFAPLFVQKTVDIDEINDGGKHMVLLRKSNGHLALVWKDEIDSQKGFYVKGFDKDLEVIVPTQMLDESEFFGNFVDFRVIDGTGKNNDFGLVNTHTTGFDEYCNLLTFDFFPILKNRHPINRIYLKR